MNMFVFCGIAMMMIATFNVVFCARLNDEFTVGTSLNKYLWAPSNAADDDIVKRDGDKRTSALWFGPRLGKRNQASSNENLPIEILEILQKIQKSPELQNILAEKLQVDGSMPYVIYVPSPKSDSHLMMPRYLRDSPDMSQNLNSRPYPPRFGRQTGGLPPYLPRLGRSDKSGDAE